MAKAKSISPGIHTFQEVLDKAGVDYDEAVTVEDDNGPRVDNRRVLVGGLAFDDPNNVLNIAEDGEEVEIRVDGKSVAKLAVDKDAGFRSATQLPDHARLVHTDEEGTRLVQKSELEF